MDDQPPPPYSASEAGPSRPRLTRARVPAYSRAESRSPSGPNSSSNWANESDNAPPYNATKRLVLWPAENRNSTRRARDFTDELCPATVLSSAFSLDRRKITNVRHMSDGCSLHPVTFGYLLTGGVEMWSDSHRAHEYHWGGETVDRAKNWRLANAADGAAVRKDVNCVVDVSAGENARVRDEVGQRASRVGVVLGVGLMAACPSCG